MVYTVQLIMARYTRIINCRPCCNLYIKHCTYDLIVCCVTDYFTVCLSLRLVNALTINEYYVISQFIYVAVLQMQCMYRPVILSFSFCIFHTEIGTILESRACS